MRGLVAAQGPAIVFAAGLSLAFIGAWWLSPAAAMIAIGVTLCVAAIGAELAGVRRTP